MTYSKISTAFLVLMLLLGLGGCSVILGEALVGSGVTVSEDRDVDEFTKISASGALQIKAIVGEEQQVLVSGDDNIVPLVKTTVSDGTLTLSLEHDGRVQTKEPLEITVTAALISGSHLSGACNLSVDGVQGDGFDAELSGASTLNVTGQSKQLQVELSGASTLNANDLICEDVTVSVSGASNAMVHATNSITGHASGASTVRYAGQPSNTSVSVSGASSAKQQP